ncbi:dolichol kinase [Leptospira sp. GIMC2001]|uniref:dolichol kinase n=1 Tax=Leptospira sp. GIMC2001 TaxID=1513297 RepID=UPI00234A5146|nr:dolichol kinase [Leptospira sp. GIMC2001]WCL48026.1 dolichol kinase [Leptospira sp. GIMC2001]
MNQKSEFNFLRKGWHLLGLFIPLALYIDLFDGTFDKLHATRMIIVIGLIISLILLVLLEYLRFKSQAFSELFWKIFGAIMKEGERKNMNATIPYFTANMFVILLFPPELAILSLAFLVIGDPFAAYIGSNYGKNRFYNGKSLEGIIAFIISASIFGLMLILVYSIHHPETPYSFFGVSGEFQFSSIIILFTGTIIAGITEFFSSTAWKGFLDDNLLIPIVSVIAMGLVTTWVFGFPMDSILFDPMTLFDNR